MRWLNYKLYGNISDEPKQLFQYTHTGRKNIEAIERRVGAFYDVHRAMIHGIFIFRFWQDIAEAPPQIDHVTIPERYYTEMIRLRFRVADEDYSRAFDAFKAEVIDVLSAGAAADASSAAQAVDGPCLQGWRYYEGYEARNDVGARFGDPAHGLDATEEIVEILTGWTKLRFCVLAHPQAQPNNDLVNLYYNTIGLSYPEELDELERRIASLRWSMSRAVGL